MQGQDPSPQGSYSQQVGKMAERNQQQRQEEVPDHPQFRQQAQEAEEGPVRRGDGTILQESDKPRNPKKKMWEEDKERAKYEAAHAEKQAVDAERSGQRDKDEL